MKRCSKCKEEKPLSEYNKKTDRGLQSNCRECCHILFKEYYNNNKTYHLAEVRKQKRRQKSLLRTYIRQHLETHPCVDCGESDWIVLEFDHVRGKKKYNIAKLNGSAYSLDTLKAEIDKCEVRCCNCHRRVTYKRQKSYRVQSSTG